MENLKQHYHRDPAGSTDALKSRFIEVYERKNPPEIEPYIQLLKRANQLLDNETENIRPYDSSGLPGGLIYLKEDIPTIIVPDIHGRMDFFLSLLFATESDGDSILDKTARETLQILCLGDGFHSERRGADRWKKALDEFKDSYEKHNHMDDEMRENLGVMEMVQELKLAFPDHFHFLKGNHENIANEKGEGNFPFRKYAFEGPMVMEYVTKFYGEAFLKTYYEFEKKLPLLAVGNGFLVSHSEPAAFFDKESVIEYRENPHVVEGLTWTDNDAAEEGSVQRMLQYYLGDTGPGLYFGGHRPVTGMYNLRAEGKYVQIHNPDKFIVTLVKNGRAFDPERNIIEIPNKM